MVNQVLSFLQESLVLSLEHFQFPQGVITNFLELLLILPIDFLLDILPVIMREFLVITKWIKLSHLIGNCSYLFVHDSVGPLVDSLGRHCRDTWRSVFHSSSRWLQAGLDDLRLVNVLLRDSIASNDRRWLSVILLSSDCAFVEVSAVADVGFGWLDVIVVGLLGLLVHWLVGGGRWPGFHILHGLDWLRSVLLNRWLVVLLWRSGLDNNWLSGWNKGLWRIVLLWLFVLDCLRLILGWLLLDVLRLLFVVNRLLVLRDVVGGLWLVSNRLLSWSDHLGDGSLVDGLWEGLEGLGSVLGCNRLSDCLWWPAFHNWNRLGHLLNRLLVRHRGLLNWCHLRCLRHSSRRLHLLRRRRSLDWLLICRLLWWSELLRWGLVHRLLHRRRCLRVGLLLASIGIVLLADGRIE